MNMRVRFIHVLDDALKFLTPPFGKPSDCQGTPVFVRGHLLRVVLDLRDSVGPARDADRDDRCFAPQFVPTLIDSLIGARRCQSKRLYRRPAK